MNQYIFILGREQKIALLELSSVLRRFCFDIETNPITSLSDNCVLINLPSPCHPERAAGESRDLDSMVASLMSVLGGTTKIFKVLGEEKRLNENSLVKYFKVKPGKRLTFGISSYSKKIPVNTINMLGLALKKMFKKSCSVRFVALRGEAELSTATSYGQKLYSEGTELGIFYDERARKIGIGKLIAMTNPSEWSHRDFDKPKSDRFSGMVPPKLARAMVNIALGNLKTQETRNKQITNSNAQTLEGVIASEAKQSNNIAIQQFNNTERPTVVDPFCGSGNILMEAMMLGCNVVGSDVSEKAVNDTKINLAWLKDEINKSKGRSQNYNSKVENTDAEDCHSGLVSESHNNETIQQFNNEIFQADATMFDFSKLISQQTQGVPFGTNQLKNLCIVSEPYLGEPKKFKPTLNSAKGEYSKIKDIYLGFLKNLHANQLKSFKLENICLVFPAVETVEGKIFSLLKESVDEINDLGYTLVCKPLLYGRDYQVVKREIVLLQKTTNN